MQDAEAGEAGGGTISLPWSTEAAGDVGFIVSVPGEVKDSDSTEVPHAGDGGCLR